MTYEEQAEMNTYKNTVQFDGKQYWVRLPWRPDHEVLPLTMAKGRLTNSLNKLRSQSEYTDHYDRMNTDQVTKGIIERVNDAIVSKNTHYLPHLPVIRPSKATLLYIVFDCSASVKGGMSLNYLLFTGSSLKDKLLDVSLKFRVDIYAFTADISRAVLRIGLQESDRDSTHFLWPKDPVNPRDTPFQGSVIWRKQFTIIITNDSRTFLEQPKAKYGCDEQVIICTELR